MTEQLIIIDEPDGKDGDAILTELAAFNGQNGYPSDMKLMAILLKDELGKTIGGLWGKTIYDWLFIENVFIPEKMRGFNVGRSIINAAEQRAMERGCVGSWLTTFSFQAQEFYEKLGYVVFGNLENCPGKNRRIFLQKRLSR